MIGFKQFCESKLDRNPKIGDKITLINDRYCDWGPCEGPVIINVDGTVVTISRDEKDIKSPGVNQTRSEEDDTWKIDFSKVKELYSGKLGWTLE